ncbi:MAG TPA: DUF1080 domain-containing protein, partial [Clostridia bacterium]|nr:DUF1080 domain-containing protein [Clostridia bacterium]
TSPRLLLPAFLFISCVVSGSAVEPGFESMFNGTDLAGWQGKPGWWQVEDGAITSESTKAKPCDAAHYLVWRGGKPGDFEMRLEFRLLGDGGNSGIQFRSREVPEWDTSGYQADIENGDQWTGCLFEHTRGGISMRGQKVLIAPDGKKQVLPLPSGKSPAELLQCFKRNEWNSYTIIACGSEITLKINDVVMCQATDEQTSLAAREGIIALQMHPGPPMKVQFRNLRIKSLTPEKAATHTK